ncbi:hypothetical protein A0U91_11340 [Acetobacter persici]|uniref:Uncharacterized protein n=1 Tax=Acetobacter persici TaxID=1076596 RepID=A0A1U9LFW9_9PROT|nr:hypothetical protein A0U91_11340 [Acetobacter persici]
MHGASAVLVAAAPPEDGSAREGTECAKARAIRQPAPDAPRHAGGVPVVWMTRLFSESRDLRDTEKSQS